MAHRFSDTKKCPICGSNIIASAFDRHVDRHGSVTAEEHRRKFSSESLRQRDAEVARIAEENRRQEIARKEEIRRSEEAWKNRVPEYVDHAALLVKLQSALDGLRAALRSFPGPELASMLCEVEKLRASSPRDVGDVQRFLWRWCSEDFFGRCEYETGSGNPASDRAFEQCVVAARKAEVLVGNLLSVESDLDARGLRFVIACIDAGCTPPLVQGCGKAAVDSLRRDLLDEIESLEKTGRRHRY